jgi:hypothetical protein
LSVKLIKLLLATFACITIASVATPDVGAPIVTPQLPCPWSNDRLVDVGATIKIIVPFISEAQISAGVERYYRDRFGCQTCSTEGVQQGEACEKDVDTSSVIVDPAGEMTGNSFLVVTLLSGYVTRICDCPDAPAAP